MENTQNESYSKSTEAVGVTETAKVKASLSQNKEDKGNLTITIVLTEKQREKFLLEKGRQPQDIMKIVVIGGNE